MGVLGAIVLSKALLMRAAQAELPECRSVGAELVGYQQFRREALFPEQLAHQPQRRPLVASEPAYREPRPRDRQRATDTFADRRFARPSRRDATDRSGVGGTDGADAQSWTRTSEPSAAPSRKKVPARAQRVALPHRGSSRRTG